MFYGEILKGKWVRRLNRFIGEVDHDGNLEKVHIKNTGRLSELLLPKATVFLEKSSNPNRKTRFSLIGVEKDGFFVNIDSLAPNTIVYEGLLKGAIYEIPNVELVKKEARFRDSRFDLFIKNQYMEGYVEVKGVTLQKDQVALFPDAPTARGTKHVLEMIEAVKEGYLGVLFFLVQIKGCSYFSANEEMDPSFAGALVKAKNAGVMILAYEAEFDEREGFTIGRQIPVRI